MNKQEKAYNILERYQLINKLEKIGKTFVIGSLKMGLMVSNDIDIDVDNASMSIEQLYEFTRYVLKEFYPTWYEAKEEINDAGERVWFHGFEAIIDGELWNFDIWFLNRETVKKAERYCEQIIEQVSANKEAKERIILLKKQLIERDLYSFDKFTSMDVYKAVLENDVSDIESFLENGKN